MAREQLLERNFEENVAEALAERGWVYEPHARDAGWDPSLALFPEDALSWLRSQYPEEYRKATAGAQSDAELAKADRKLLERLAEVLATTTQVDAKKGTPRGGLLGVLHTGYRHSQIGHAAANFGPMVAFPPENPNITSAVKAANENRLRVLRQVHFDPAKGDTIDLVLTVNGVPVVTIELKTDNTQVVEDAIEQYRVARVPSKSRPLLAPGRVLVHFAVSSSKVFMTTKLDGAATTFLPFNMGTEDGHQGNPSSETGSDTDYLWRDVLERESLLRILKDYAFFQPGSGKGKSAKGKAGTLIFPRYHQRRAVEAVVNDVERGGVGGRYLIWHSAGSGKTKTISWLAHRLIRQMDFEGEKTFDSVIVVSDRTVLDRNLRDGINLLRASEGLVINVGTKSGSKSSQLRTALKAGGHIITCTLQTFPEVLSLIGSDELAGRTWCVIADEAHSSQSGTASGALRRLLGEMVTTSEDGEVLTGDDLLIAEGAAIAGTARNTTYIALTATPKAKTLRTFGVNTGTEDEPRWEAFDTYTMAQAIEEGFIRDVLTNYSTYAMFAKVRDELGRETEVDKASAVADIVGFVRLHDTSIAQKVRVVVEHFRRNVMHHLNGHAKAMVVTESRAAAVKWSRAMNEYIAKSGYRDMRTLVAFSGSLTIDGDEVSEAGLNQRSDTEYAFRTEDSYKVLIVADKFQTGFDEPRLCAMYVDKKLSGITAVQTLSRLNRTMPGKPAPMVVDFRNTPESIQDDFKLYYSDAHVVGDVSVNALNTLADRIDGSAYADEDDIVAISDAFLNNENHETLQRFTSPVRKKWEAALRDARKAKDQDAIDEVIGFRSDLGSYRHAWEFISQITDFQDAMYRRRAIFAAVIERNLHLARPSREDYTAGLSLVGVELSPERIGDDVGVGTGEENHEPLELPVFGGEHGGEGSPIKEKFEEVIERVNDMFASAGIDVSRSIQDGFVRAMWGTLMEDPAFEAMTKENSAAQLSQSDAFSSKVTGTIIDINEGNKAMLESMLGEPENLAVITNGMAELAEAAWQTAYDEIEGDADEDEETRAE